MKYPDWMIEVLTKRHCPICAQPMGDEGMHRVQHVTCNKRTATDVNDPS